MDTFISNLKGLGRTRLLLLGATGLIIVLAVAGLAMMISKPQMAPLYSDLSAADAGKVVSKLEAMDIPVDVARDGTTILVPKERVARLRMQLAEQGLPLSGSIGYELFDDQSSLGLTSFMQQMNRLRALEGELGRTIQALEDVQAARVHLVLPERDAFTRERPEPTASVVVRMRDSASLARERAVAIRHLVASAVPRLKSGNVTVLDARGNVLFAEDTGTAAVASNVVGMRAERQHQLVQAVERMLIPRLGPGNVRVQAAVDLHMDREVVLENQFDPSQTAVRSNQSIEEVERSSEITNEDATTVEQNLPEADVPTDTDLQNRTDLQRLEEVTNYEVSSVRRERVREPGDVRRISVAVLVNGTYETTAEGGEVYVPRSQDELQRIENLVKSAIGFDAGRGDSVTVENLEFFDLESELPAVQPPSVPQVLSQNIMTLIQWGVLLIITLLLVLLGVRPLLRALLPAPRPKDLPLAPEEVELQEGRAGDGGEGQGDPALAGGTEPAPHTALPQPSMEEALDSMMELRAVEGKVRASSVQKIGKLVDEYPDEVIAILRAWIYEEAA